MNRRFTDLLASTHVTSDTTQEDTADCEITGRKQAHMPVVNITLALYIQRAALGLLG